MDPLYLTGTITGGVAALTALGWVGRGLWRMASRIADLHGDWQGEPDRPGVKGRKGVMERLRDIEQELHPNGGGSLRDAVDRYGGQLADHLRSHATPVQVNVGTPPPADPSG